MGIKLKKSNLVFYWLSSIGLLIAILGYFVLPYSFFIDADIIVYDWYNEIGLIGGYPFSMWFYKTTGMKHLHYSIVGLIQYPILMYIIYKIGVPKKFHVVTIKNAVVYISFLLIAIFISMPSKEFINFIYIGFIVFLFKNRKRKLSATLRIAFAMLIFFAIFFREYFSVVVILSIVMYVISLINFKNKRLVSITAGLIVVIFVSLSYGVVKGQFFSESSRHVFNQMRIEKDKANANSMIIPPLPPDTWYGESFGIVYGFFSVNLPVNGLKHILSPQIIAFIIWQTILIVILFYRFKKNMKEGRKGNYELWLFYMIFSYFIVQGVFEPDLGSAVRHKIGVFPLIYYLLYYEEFRKKLS